MGSRCLNKGLQLSEDSPLCNTITIRSLCYTETSGSESSMNVTPASHRHKCVLWVFFFFLHFTFMLYNKGKCLYFMKLFLHSHYTVHLISSSILWESNPWPWCCLHHALLVWVTSCIFILPLQILQSYWCTYSILAYHILILSKIM